MASIGDLPAFPHTRDQLATGMAGMPYRMHLVAQIAAGALPYDSTPEGGAEAVVDLADAIIAKLDAEQEGKRG